MSAPIAAPSARALLVGGARHVDHELLGERHAHGDPGVVDVGGDGDRACARAPRDGPGPRPPPPAPGRAPRARPHPRPGPRCGRSSRRRRGSAPATGASVTARTVLPPVRESPPRPRGCVTWLRSTRSADATCEWERTDGGRDRAGDGAADREPVADGRPVPVLRAPRRRLPGRQRPLRSRRARSPGGRWAPTSPASTAGACTTAPRCRASRSTPTAASRPSPTCAAA